MNKRNEFVNELKNENNESILIRSSMMSREEREKLEREIQARRIEKGESILVASSRPRSKDIEKGR